MESKEMTENDTETTAQGNGAQAQTPKVNMRILTQYMRDLSFENVAAQKKLQGTNVQPDIQVQVSLDAQKRDTENQYDVGTKFKITSKNKTDDQVLFLIELDYVGVFLVEGVPQEQLHPFLLIECPRMIFPFARRIISDVTRDGGFPPLNLDTVDFLALYRQELQRQQALQAQNGGAAPVAN
jgi:preprotein translocase subunit SecB